MKSKKGELQDCDGFYTKQHAVSVAATLGTKCITQIFYYLAVSFLESLNLARDSLVEYHLQ